MANKTISEYTDISSPNILTEYLTQVGGVSSKTNLNNMQRLQIKTIVFSDSPYALLATDGIILVDATAGNVVINLPIVATTLSGKQWIIKKIDVSANTVTINAVALASTLIEGATTMVITSQYESKKFTTEGTTAYYLIS